MIEIIPAIMPKDRDDLLEKVNMLGDKALSIQLDLMDGEFVPAKTWPFIHEGKDDAEKKDIWERVDVGTTVELDLMVKNAADTIDGWLAIGAERVIFHLEAETNLLGKIENMREKLLGVEIGLSFNDDYPIQDIADLVPHFDFVQCMGISEIGKQGQPFSEKSLDNIAFLRSQYPNMIISVDGSVNIETAKRLVEAGANRLVVGSAIFAQDDPVQAYRDLFALVNVNK